MGIFLKHLWLIPNVLQWHDCKILIKLVSSQTIPEAVTRGVLLKKVFLKMSMIHMKARFLNHRVNKYNNLRVKKRII